MGFVVSTYSRWLIASSDLAESWALWRLRSSREETKEREETKAKGRAKTKAGPWISI